jgi:hypothetical protein
MTLQSAAPAAPSLALVAAVTFLGKQTLGSASIDGIRLRVYAYLPIKLSVQATLDRRTAKRLGLRRHPLLARRSFDFHAPGVYMVRLRLAHRAVIRLSDVLAATFVLKTVVTGPGGTATSNATLQLRR